MIMGLLWTGRFSTCLCDPVVDDVVSAAEDIVIVADRHRPLAWPSGGGLTRELPPPAASTRRRHRPRFPPPAPPSQPQRNAGAIGRGGTASAAERRSGRPGLVAARRAPSSRSARPRSPMLMLWPLGRSAASLRAGRMGTPHASTRRWRPAGACRLPSRRRCLSLHGTLATLFS